MPIKDLKKTAFSRTYGNNSPLKKVFKEDNDLKHVSSTNNIPSPPPGGLSSTIQTKPMTAASAVHRPYKRNSQNFVNVDLMNPLLSQHKRQTQPLPADRDHKQKQDRVDLKVQQIMKTEGEQRQKLAAMNKRFDRNLKEKAKKLNILNNPNIVKKNVMFVETPIKIYP